MQPEPLLRQGRCLGLVRHLRGDLQALPGLLLAGGEGPLDAPAAARVHIAHPAGAVLVLRGAGAQGRPDIQPLLLPRPLPNGEDRGLGLVFGLVEQHKLPVRRLEGDPGVLAQLGQKGAVAGLALLHPLIKRIDGRFKQTVQAVGSGDLIRNAGELVALPRLGLLCLPDGGAEGEAGPLEHDGGGRGVIFHAVQLKVACGQGGVTAPADLGDGGAEFQLCPGRRLNGPVQPAPQPLALPVLDLELQIVRLPLLVIRVGEGEEVGLDGLGDIRAVKDDLCRCAAGLVVFFHFLFLFQGGSVFRMFFSGSGSARTIPVGKV